MGMDKKTCQTFALEDFFRYFCTLEQFSKNMDDYHADSYNN